MRDGFRLKERREIGEYGMTGLWYEHSSGLEVVSLECDDRENMFCIGVSTVPEDDCGTAHIIEHSVLSGSRKYPVRDPFMEMIKGSVATFINAITYHDFTIYPVASVVPKDFFNLSSVYFDAVFNPLLSRWAFHQEGWHYEFQQPGDIRSALVRNGVVLSEMCGAMGDLDEIVAYEVNRRLFPGTSRRFLSGGHPDHITDLSYGKYCDFYSRHYHPSCARLYFYGDIPTSDKLSFISGLLAELPRRDIPKPLPCRMRQERWPSPKKNRIKYSPIMDECDGAWAQAFFLNDDVDPVTDLAFEFLDELLLGNDSSPLRSTIQESGLCDSLAISGYDNETLDTAFLIAANGVSRRNFAKMDRLVSDCLAKISENGFSERQLQASKAQFMLSRREVTGGYVYRQMENVFDAWSYGLNPFTYLDMRSTYFEFENRLSSNSGWLQGLIAKHLCENAHKLTLELVPDTSLAVKHEKRIHVKLENIKARMSEKALKKADSDAAMLKELQGMPNSAEALATLPKLRLEDVPDMPVRNKVNASRLANGVDFLDVDCFTNGISYLEIVIPAGCLDKGDLCQTMTLYKNLFRHVGTSARNHVELASELSACGGDMSTNMYFWHKGGLLNVGICFALRALDEHFGRLVELFKESLESSVFTESMFIQSRFRQLWSSVREAISCSGTAFAANRCGMGLTTHGTLRECGEGFSSFGIMRGLSRNFSSQWLDVRTRLENFEQRVSGFTPSAAAFSGSERNRHIAMDFLEKYANPVGSAVSKVVVDPIANGRREAFPVSNDTASYVRVFKAPRYEDADSIPLMVYANLLSCGKLYDEVRLKGGAYDVEASYNLANGYFALASGRDPQPLRTRGVFDSIEKISGWSENEVHKAILQTVKGCFVPYRADRAVAAALANHLNGITYDETVKRFRRYMSLTASDIHDAVGRFWKSCPDYNDCAIGPAGMMKTLEANNIKI